MIVEIQKDKLSPCINNVREHLYCYTVVVYLHTHLFCLVYVVNKATYTTMQHNTIVYDLNVYKNQYNIIHTFVYRFLDSCC